MIVVVAKFLDEFGSGRKCGQYWAGNSEETEILLDFDHR